MERLAPQLRGYPQRVDCPPARPKLNDSHEEVPGKVNFG